MSKSVPHLSEHCCGVFIKGANRQKPDFMHFWSWFYLENTVVISDRNLTWNNGHVNMNVHIPCCKYVQVSCRGTKYLTWNITQYFLVVLEREMWCRSGNFELTALKYKSWGRTFEYAGFGRLSLWYMVGRAIVLLMITFSFKHNAAVSLCMVPEHVFFECLRKWQQQNRGRTYAFEPVSLRLTTRCPTTNDPLPFESFTIYKIRCTRISLSAKKTSIELA